MLFLLIRLVIESDPSLFVPYSTARDLASDALKALAGEGGGGFGGGATLQVINAHNHSAFNIKFYQCSILFQ